MVALYRHIVDGHRRDGAGAVTGREGDVGVPLCGRGEGEDGEVFAALADIVRGTGDGDGLVGGRCRGTAVCVIHSVVPCGGRDDELRRACGDSVVDSHLEFAYHALQRHRLATGVGIDRQREGLVEGVVGLDPGDGVGGSVDGGRKATGGHEVEGVGAEGEVEGRRAEIGGGVVVLVDGLHEGVVNVVEDPHVGHRSAVGGEVFGVLYPVSRAVEGDGFGWCFCCVLAASREQ